MVYPLSSFELLGTDFLQRDSFINLEYKDNIVLFVDTMDKM